jgi:mediator of RNA polymerase II transcription subunit 31
MTDSVKNVTDEEKGKNRKRFELELEFVQALANPFYLHSLAQQGILYQPAFINYLKYLLYWKEKDYARFILWVFELSLPPILALVGLAYLLCALLSFSYPHALHHLELLQHAEFRSEIMKDEWRERLNQKQFDHWRSWYVPSSIQVTEYRMLFSAGESRAISTRLLMAMRNRTVL